MNKKIKFTKRRLIFMSIVVILVAITITFTSLNTKEVYAEDASNTSEYEVKLLARLINGEARGEPYIGQVAVGAVIMNRVKSSDFPNTISGVIYQKGQFTAISDGQFDAAIEKDSTVFKAAQDAINGTDPTNGAIYYYNPKKTTSKWIYSRPVIKTIGEHVFTK